LRTQTPEQSKNSFPGKNTRKEEEEEEEPNETAQRGGGVQPADQHRSQIVVLWKPREIESADDSHEREDRRLDRNPSTTKLEMSSYTRYRRDGLPRLTGDEGNFVEVHSCYNLLCFCEPHNI